MKNQIKKIAAFLAGAVMFQMAAGLPIYAASSPSAGATFDNASVPENLKSSKFESGTAIDGINVKGDGITWTGDAETGYNTETVTVVPDTQPLYSQDQVLRLNRNNVPGAEQNSKSIQTWAYAQYESGVRVYEYDFMFDSGVHSLVFALQSSNFRELRILNSQRTQDGDMNITTSDGKTQLAKKNQWHHVKMIADFSKTKKNADSTADILDFSQNTITCYLDGQLMIDSRPVSEWNSWEEGTTPKTWMIVNNGGSYEEYNIYLDNIKVYDPTTTGTTFEILSDAADSAYMYGNTAKLYVDSLIGSDSSYMPINKVCWYVDDGMEPAYESTTYPFTFEYPLMSEGYHTIYAEGYTANDTEVPFVYDETEIYVEPKFKETVIMYEDFSEYVDGTLDWTDIQGEGRYEILNATTETGLTTKNIDTEHGKSLSLGTNSGRSIAGYPEGQLSEGTYKFSAEYYFDGAIGNNNLLMVLKMPNSQDINSFLMHGARVLKNRQNGDADLITLKADKWYKIDWITTVRDGETFYTAYVDGKQIVHGPYTGDKTPAEKLRGVVFFASSNSDGNVYVDNLSISKIQYYDNTGFYCDDREISSLAEMTGTVITAKTAVITPEENQQYMAVYDKATNQLKKIVAGVYDDRTKAYTANCDISGIEEPQVKVFVWDGMKPTLENPEIIE